jgi:hypothetical protein
MSIFVCRTFTGSFPDDDDLPFPAFADDGVEAVAVVMATSLVVEETIRVGDDAAAGDASRRAAAGTGDYTAAAPTANERR